MTPTLLPGAIVLASGWYSSIKPGDVVVIHHSGLEKIKRVTDISKKGLFVTGDNSQASTDSRQFGWISSTNVIGKVIWPIRV